MSKNNKGNVTITNTIKQQGECNNMNNNTESTKTFNGTTVEKQKEMVNMTTNNTKKANKKKKKDYGITMTPDAIKGLALGKQTTVLIPKVILSRYGATIEMTRKAGAPYVKHFNKASMTINGNTVIDNVVEGLSSLEINGKAKNIACLATWTMNKPMYVNFAKGLVAAKTARGIYIDFCTGHRINSEFMTEDTVRKFTPLNASPSQDRLSQCNMIDRTIVNADAVVSEETFGMLDYLKTRNFETLTALGKAVVRTSQPFVGMKEIGKGISTWMCYVGEFGEIGANNQSARREALAETATDEEISKYNRATIEPCAIDGASIITSQYLQTCLMEEHNLKVDLMSLHGTLMQCRPYAMKTQAEAVDEATVESFLENVERVVYSREELAKNPELHRTVQNAVFNVKKYGKTAGLNGKLLVIVNTEADKENYKVQFVTDLNAMKSAIDFTKTSKLRILQMPKTSSAHTSKQMLSKLFSDDPLLASESFARVSEDTIDSKLGGLGKLIGKNMHEGKSLLAFNTIDDSKFNMLEAIRMTSPETAVAVEKVFESSLSSTTTALASSLSKQHCKINGLYLQLLSDYSAAFYGVKLLGMKECFAPGADAQNATEGVALKYPCPGSKEFAKLKVVSFEEMKERINSSSLTDEQKVKLIRYFRNVKKYSLILSAGSPIKDLLAGADFDFDAALFTFNCALADAFKEIEPVVVSIRYSKTNNVKRKNRIRQQADMLKRDFSIEKDQASYIISGLDSKGRNVGMCTNDADCLNAILMNVKVAKADMKEAQLNNDILSYNKAKAKLQKQVDILNTAHFGDKQRVKNLNMWNESMFEGTSVVEEIFKLMPKTVTIEDSCEFAKPTVFTRVTIETKNVPTIESLIIDTEWTTENIEGKLEACDYLGRYYQESTIDSAKDKTKFYAGQVFSRDLKHWANGDLSLNYDRKNKSIIIRDSYNVLGLANGSIGFSAEDLNAVINESIIKYYPIDKRTGETQKDPNYIIISPLAKSRIEFANEIGATIANMAEVRDECMSGLYNSEFTDDVISLNEKLIEAAADINIISEFSDEGIFGTESYTYNVIDRANKDYLAITSLKANDSKDDSTNTFNSQQAKELQVVLSNMIRNVAKEEGIGSIELGRLIMRATILKGSTISCNICAEEVYMFLMSLGATSCNYYGSKIKTGHKHVQENEVLDFVLGKCINSNNQYIGLDDITFTGTATIKEINGKMCAVKDLYTGLKTIIESQMATTPSNQVVFTVIADDIKTNTFFASNTEKGEKRLSMTDISKNLVAGYNEGAIRVGSFDTAVYNDQINVSMFLADNTRIGSIVTSQSLATHLSNAIISIDKVIAPQRRFNKDLNKYEDYNEYAKFIVTATVEDFISPFNALDAAELTMKQVSQVEDSNELNKNVVEMNETEIENFSAPFAPIDLSQYDGMGLNDIVIETPLTEAELLELEAQEAAMALVTNESIVEETLTEVEAPINSNIDTKTVALKEKPVVAPKQKSFNSMFTASAFTATKVEEPVAPSKEEVITKPAANKKSFNSMFTVDGFTASKM